MRKEFSAWLTAHAGGDERVVVLTGDLGFGALEPVQQKIGARFVNAGVSEQNMVSVAAGLASEGLRALCYSIAPFAVFRPAEQIRLDVCIHGLDVKVVGNGGGYGYGIMGSTHHAIEDIAVLSAFPHMHCFVPVTGDDVAVCADAMMAEVGPGYLRLNLGSLPPGFTLGGPFAPLRRVGAPSGSATPALTVVGLGPILLNTLAAPLPAGSVEWFAASQMPLPSLSAELTASLKRTGRLLVVEEHVERGGLAEHLALHLMREGLAPRLYSRHARGYPSKTYGSQAFHQKESGLDATSLHTLMQEIVRA